MTQRIIFIVCILFFSISVFAKNGSIIFRNGHSKYKIYISNSAPSSVQRAAKEMQHYVQRSGHTKLEIVQSGKPPLVSFISLGNNIATKNAGFNSDNLSLGGYRIVTQSNNLYIFGLDTKDGKLTPQGGISTGTLNGVHTFLEKQLGIRWLMPGPNGDYVPEHNTLVLKEIDRIDKPGFARRLLPYIGKNSRSTKGLPKVPNRSIELTQWSRRNKQGESIQLWHTHNWTRTISKSLYKKHQDWFAMVNGKRKKPEGRYKLETTNSELVHEFAKRAVKYLKEHPKFYSYSISPSDGLGFSQSPASKALYDPPHDGHDYPSVTPLILKFYIDVANLVKKYAPQKAVAGYIYSNYIYPPKAGIPKLPDNLYLIVAGAGGYGYGMYNPDKRKRFEKILGEWSSSTNNIGYYGIPNKQENPYGAPMPPALGILSFIYHHLAQYNLKEVLVYGRSAWGSGAVANYVMAKLNWNPNANPYKLAHEFYIDAYGPKAGPIMQGMYEWLNRKFKQYYSKHKSGYSISTSAMKNLYAKCYPRIEASYLKARSLVKGEKRKARLEMFGASLALFQWNLRQRGMIITDKSSPLYRTTKEILAMINNPKYKLALPTHININKKIINKKAPAPDKVRVYMPSHNVSHAPKIKPMYIRGSARLLLLARNNGEIVVKPSHVYYKGSIIRYFVTSHDGQIIKKGTMVNGSSIRFNGKNGKHYFLDIYVNNDMTSYYQLAVHNADFAIKTCGPYGKRKNLHLLFKPTTLYFYVPRNLDKFSILLRAHQSLHGRPNPHETAAADIIAPSGRIVASLDAVNKPLDRTTIHPDGKSGFWRIRFTKVKSGSYDDLWIRFGKTLTPWVMTNSKGLFIIQDNNE